MKSKTINLIFTAFLAWILVVPAVAQQKKNWVLKNSSVEIKGTSNLHDWEMNAREVSGWFTGTLDKADLKSINNAKLSFEATDIVSESSIMTKKAQESLNADKHPEIIFTSVSIENYEPTQSAFKATVKGKLNIAGKTRMITVPVNGKITGDEKVTINAKYSLKMSDYNIDPPNAMLGTLKTGDRVMLNFTLHFINDQAISSAKK